MADIANQLEGAVEGLDRFLEALDNSSMKLGSTAAIESKLARAAAKKANQDLRFRKKIEKMEKETTKREAQHLAQLKALQPLRKKLFDGLKQELNTKSDLIKQTKGLGDVFKKTGAGLGGMFKALGSGMSKALGALGKGFTGATGLLGGLKDVLGKLGQIEIAGFSVGKAIGAAVATAKLLHDFMSSNEKLTKDIAKQTGIMYDPKKQNKYLDQVKETHKELGKYGYTMKETVQLTQDMREAFGDVSYVTSKMVETSAQLQMNYRVATEDANELVEAMARTGYESDKFLKTIEKTAITMGADVGMAMRDVAKNTQMMELYAGRGEEYFARMASRAALLGTNMQSIEDSGKAFEDFEQMAENMNVTATLFGDGFNDGLKTLTEIRMMYERGNILGIQEHYAQQIGKTMEYEKVKGKWLLINQRTGEEMMQSQINSAATLMGMDKVSAIRTIKAAEMQSLLKKDGFALTEDMLKLHGADAAQIELFQASEFDHSMAMFSALREKQVIAKDEQGNLMKEKIAKEDIYKIEDGINTLVTKKGEVEVAATYERQFTESRIIEMLKAEGDQLKINREILLKAAHEEMANRAKTVKFQEDLPTKTLAMMTELELTMSEVNRTMERVAQSIGEKMEQQFGDKKGEISATFRNIISGFGDEFVKSMEASDTQTGVMSAIQAASLAGLKGAMSAAFKSLTLEKLKGLGWVDTMSAGFTAAFGGAEGGPAGVFVKTIIEQIEANAVQLQKLFADILGGAIGQALSGIPILGHFTDVARQTSQVSGDPSSPGFKDAGATLQLERGLRGQYGTQTDASHLANALDNIVQEATGGQFDVHTTTLMGEDRRLLEAMLTLAAAEEDVSLTAADLAAGFIEFKKEGFDNFTEDVDKFLLAQLEGGATFTAAVEELKKQQNETSWRGITSLRAKGWAGGAHRGIVGEAGTEVGITKSALRELASAGIPGYQNGFVGAATNTQGLFAGAGSVPERGRRQAAAFDAGEEYRDRIRNYEQSFLAIEYNTGQLEKGQPWWVKLMVNGLKDKGVMDSVLNKIRELQVKLLSEDIKQTVLTKAGNALLGGIGSGLDAASKVLQAGGSGKQAREAAKRGLIGGFVRDIAASFGGTADKGYLQNQQSLGALFAAKGRVFSQPTLAVVGEGGANEVVIPTERIRKGLPINAGVAKELASIGVPGFEEGALMQFGAGPKRDYVGPGGPSAKDQPKAEAKASGGLGGFFSDNWESGVATAGLSFMNAYMQTGDSGYAAGQAAGSALGFGIQMGISAIPIPGAAIVGQIVGPLIGAKIGGWLGKKFMYKPKYEKHQKRALKNVEDLVASQGIFMHGQPPGIKSQIVKGMHGSRKKHPSDEEKDKMIKMFADSPVLRYGFQPGASPSQLLALLAGQVGSTADELSMYKRYNSAFYGTPMAKGGIVTRPTNAIIGEAGPEAVIPLGQHDGYATRQQRQDQKDIITELKKQNQQMQMFIKKVGDGKTVLQVDGRILAETVGSNMYDINSGI